jgi:hypothetical protein
MSYTDEQRARFAIKGWPRPKGDERCRCTTLEGERCRKRRAPLGFRCQQHERMASAGPNRRARDPRRS